MPSPSEGSKPDSTPPLADAPTASAHAPTSSHCVAASPTDAKAASEPPLASAATLDKAKPFSNVKAAAPCLPPATQGGASTTNSPLSSSSPPSSLPCQTSSSRSPTAVPAPTFIAPVAPSPIAAHGFLPPASLPRCSPTPPSLQRPLSPHPSSAPSVQTTPSSSVAQHAARVHQAPPITTQSPGKK